MRIKLIALLAVVAAAVAVPAGGIGAPPADQVHGPACADITLIAPGDSSNPPVYTTSVTGTATVYAELTTAKASCSGITYTIYLYDESGTTLLTDPTTYTGDGTTSSFSYEFSPAGAPTRVCILATSSRDGRIIDSAPNSGCGVLVLNGGSPGGQGYF